MKKQTKTFRRFRHKSGFLDGTNYISVCSNGKIYFVSNKRTRVKAKGWKLEICLKHVQEGAWIEIT